MERTRIDNYVIGGTDARHPIPFTAGIPIARGGLRDPGGLALTASDGRLLPHQAQTTSRWPDGSIRWLLCDFAVPNGQAVFLEAGGQRDLPMPEHSASVVQRGDAVRLDNGLIWVELARGAKGVRMGSHQSREEAFIHSEVVIGGAACDIASEPVIEEIEVYASGPMRAAASIKGTRRYQDGAVGPFSQRVEVFADSAAARIEDSFVYAHLPGTHAHPQHPLRRWALVGDRAIAFRPAVDPEEAEGVIIGDRSMAFWGIDEPLDLSRHTDEDLFGEDAPGIALGVAKSCAAIVSFAVYDTKDTCRSYPIHGAFAYPDPQAYLGAIPGFSVIPKDQIGGAAERFAVVEEGLRQGLGFWMWFQDHDPVGYRGRGPWHGLFDWGDWQVRYTSPYDDRPVGWQYDEGRYGWDSGEMDTVLMLWHAFAHTGDPAYLRPSVAMSRHAMDVDTIHVDYRDYSVPEYVYDSHHYDAPWREGRDRLYDKSTLGMGRRHNVQHWGNGIGDTRHTFNSGVAMYYLMTGNRRAYDAALMMADMHMQRLYGYAAGEYTLAMECIYWAYRISGEERYLAEFTYRLSVIHALQLPDGSLPLHIDFDAKTDYKEVDGDGGAHSSLTLDYISNALADYHADTRDPIAAEVLLRLATCACARNDPRYGLSYPDLSDLRILSWAFDHTGDRKFYDRLFYLTFTMATQPLEHRPQTASEWVELTRNVQWRQRWRLRHIGPGLRMIPYALAVL